MKTKNISSFLIALGVAAIFQFPEISNAASPTFTILDAEGNYGRPTGISANGSIVANPTRYIPSTIWENGVVEQIGNYSIYDRVNGISADGSVVVGSTYGHGAWVANQPGYPNNSGATPVYWTHTSGPVNTMVTLGYMGVNNGGVFSGLDVWAFGSVNAVSADGSTLVGSFDSTATLYNTSGNQTGALWNGSGYHNLGALAGNNTSVATSVSANGSVVVGYSYNYNGGSYPPTAVRWTSSGISSLGVLPNGYSSQATDVSDDGSVVIGNADGNGFRWTSLGMEKLPDLYNTHYFTHANAISGDGLLIGGGIELGSQNYAGDWTATFWWDGKVFSFGAYLASIGFSTPSWSLSEITAISGDSLTGYNIAGYGWGPTHAGGNYGNAFLITGFTPPAVAVPEASTFTMYGVASAVVAGCLLRRRRAAQASA